MLGLSLRCGWLFRQTLATITLQNYFLMYDKLSGMTGTAAEDFEPARM